MTELERFCIFCARFLTDEQGEPLVIEDFQKRILGDYFDGVRETVVIVGKKNGKSSLLGALDTLSFNLAPRFGADIDFMNDFVRNHKRCLCGTQAERLANGAYSIGCVCSFAGKPFALR